MKRDSFIFYRSFFESTKPLSQEQKAQLYDAICLYSLEHEEIKLDPIGTAMFSLIKPQLEANYKRFLNGIKGAKVKQELSKSKAKTKQVSTKTKANVNVNVNDNVNVNVKDKVKAHTAFKHLKLSTNEFDRLAAISGETATLEILEQIENFKGNTKYTSLYLTAKQWLKRRENDKPENNKPSNFDQERTFGVSL
tara:strand:+ start:748 stop:1329 length:582 start_codon:yes stop_codon:yes gene_type:complete